MRHIIIYAEDYDYDVWKEYCDICDADYDATYIKIAFNDEDVEFGNEEEE